MRVGFHFRQWKIYVTYSLNVIKLTNIMTIAYAHTCEDTVCPNNYAHLSHFVVIFYLVMATFTHMLSRLPGYNGQS